MKSLSTIFTLTFTVMFSSTSFGEWTAVGENVDGTIFYVDFERIRKHDGYVYWWRLLDYLKPEDGDLSYKIYQQGDCKLFLIKSLSGVAHKEPMGGGTGYDHYSPENPKWHYPPPNSVDESILQSVCSW